RQGRPHRAESIHALGEAGLGRAHVELQLARADIVENGVAGDAGRRLAFADAPRPPADDDGQLGLVVELNDAGWLRDRGAGADDRARELDEDARLLLRGKPALGGMRPVIAA